MKLTLTLFALFIQSAGLQVNDAWVRAAENEMATALYFKVVNNSDKPDTLYKVTSSVSDEIELHESYLKNEMYRMREVKFVVIPPKSSFEFKPKSFHVMILEVNRDLNTGDKVDFSFHFSNGKTIKSTATVR